jgi:hypothetical protein
MSPDTVSIKRGLVGASVLLLLLLCGGLAMAVGLLGGTVLSIDKESRQLTLQMPEGYSTLFPAANEAVLKDIKVGDRVSIELDREGKITKLIRLAIDQGN